MVPSKSELRLEGPGTFTTGNPFHATILGLHSGKPAEAERHFADATSWGYRVAARLTYNNVIGAVNVIPRFSWRHDVNGNTPSPIQNFLEDRKALTLGVGFTYRETWEADISVTTFFGAGEHNLINDRDFVNLEVKYSF